MKGYGVQRQLWDRWAKTLSWKSHSLASSSTILCPNPKYPIQNQRRGLGPGVIYELYKSELPYGVNLLSNRVWECTVCSIFQPISVSAAEVDGKEGKAERSSSTLSPRLQGLYGSWAPSSDWVWWGLSSSVPCGLSGLTPKYFLVFSSPGAFGRVLSPLWVGDKAKEDWEYSALASEGEKIKASWLLGCSGKWAFYCLSDLQSEPRLD